MQPLSCRPAAPLRGHAQKRGRDRLAQDEQQLCPGMAPLWMPPGSRAGCRPCHGCFLTHTACPLSEAPATLNSCHGRRFLWEQILQETQSAVYRIMGCSWLRPRLALGANTDIHTAWRGFAGAPRGLGQCRGDPPLFLPVWGWNPPSTKEEKNKDIQDRTWRETHLPFSGSPQR